ncbi:prepilin-type N-terminal cleavage/methylation domain-containing protein [Deinococcus radiopugnans]|uniref:prepilin-type N-terminal cleavage/methylation domain-containing protein n=1 Tax=Deinococcus radiopugnans TaxID=57497 RepID=UPI0009DDF611|nr:prepilin-type N-terminal cleavage/methylation domain-containing protein [Deinococcus radiopugnans]
MRQSLGFTLLELLIAIVVLTILVAILTPNLIQARNRANDMASSSYLRNCITSLESLRDGLTGKLETIPATCNDYAFGNAHQVLPDAVISSKIEFDVACDSYLVTVTSKTGRVFKHDGHTFVADNS